MSDTPRTDELIGFLEANPQLPKAAAFLGLSQQLERELADYRRGEFICKRCGIRKDAEDSHQDHGF